MLREININGIEGKVLVKTVEVSRETWDSLINAKNPETLDYLLCKRNVIEIPLNDFMDESCYGDLTFFAEEINGALNDGAELLYIEEK